METRRAGLADLDVLVPLFEGYRHFYRAEPAHEAARRFLAERLAKQDSIILIAGEGGEATGFVQLYPLFTSVGMAPVLVLNDLFVDPGYRAKGVGRALIEAAEDVARQTGVSRLRLSTQNGNTTAQALYEAMGWTLDREFRSYSRTL